MRIYKLQSSVCVFHKPRCSLIALVQLKLCASASTTIISLKSLTFASGHAHQELNISFATIVADVFKGLLFPVGFDFSIF